MALPDSPSPPSSPTMSRQPKRWARKCERACCSVLRYFPLAFVYGLTTWAVWAEASIGYYEQRPRWTGRSTSILGVTFYILLNWSYTTAVFTDPGSPLDDKHSYSQLPTHDTSSFTVKSTGGTRFCKKCQARKPDRAHHCSSCQRCVLKMDHHCPWLASCLGLRNYKPFILFLTYTCIFCWICFAASSSWVWSEVLNDNYSDSLMPINFILLAVISGIIGLVLSGFTGWHMMLVCKGQTTIECLEKTRYLSPLRKTMHRQYQQRHSIDENPGVGQQLLDMHANALPGITRPEEGEERSSPTLGPSPAQRSLYRNYEDIEEAREREQYEDYMDERDSEKLPHAFDLGWKRNLAHVLGPNKLLWLFPICNTTGDGWNWEPSPKWLEARETMRIEREARSREEHRQWPDQYATEEAYNPYQVSNQSQGNAALPRRPQSSMSMQTLQPSPDQGPNGDLLRGDEGDEHRSGSQHVPSRGVWKDDRW